MDKSKTKQQLLLENEELRARLEEAEGTLRAIRSGEVDALVVADTQGERVYTLQGADRPYRILLETMEEGAATLGNDGIILYCNRRLATMLEAPIERVTGSSVGDYLLPADWEKFSELLKERNEVRRSEFELQTIGGNRLPANLSLGSLQDTAIPGFCLTAADLTRQKRVEEALRTAHGELEERVKDRTKELSKEIEDRKRAEEALKKAHDELEVRVQERTNELAKANKELQEEIIYREKAEDQLRQAQKLEAIGTLTGGIAHDFNNILGAVVINSEMALLGLPRGSALRTNLELILKAGIRGRDLVAQMLLFSRKAEKKQEILTLTPLIKETFKLLRASIPTTIQMKLLLETEFDAVYADPSQIQQVIMNLCTNAAYAMRGTTGAIDISLQGITFGPTGLPEADMQAGDYLVLSVKDTGSGMDQEMTKRIFEPFFTTKPVGEGTGLGLSVVYGIVKNHKGGIRVYSEPGKGSIFEVYLPRVATRTSVGPDAPKPIPKGNERILLVDDEESNIKTLQNMLQQLGYKVTALMDSQEALRLFSGNPSQFNLVITDQTMPFMTGEDLGKEFMRLRPDIPVILCTGYSDLISSEKATALGFRGYIMKPFTVREGAELVRRVLDQKEPSNLRKMP